MAIRPGGRGASQTQRFDPLGGIWDGDADNGTDAPYEAITLRNFESIPQIARIPEELRREIKVVGNVLPFKSNRYVIEHLIV